MRAESRESIPAPLLAAIVHQAEQGYPSEICGLIIGRADDPAAWEIRPVANIADAEEQADPAGMLRDARSAYLMDPLEELAILRETDTRGWDLVAIYHSHPDQDAYFSAMDRERALLDTGEPLWPDVTYLVVSVRAGRAGRACACWWDSDSRTFLEAALPVR